MVIRCPDEATRIAALETGMTDGMGVTFDLLDGVLTDLDR